MRREQRSRVVGPSHQAGALSIRRATRALFLAIRARPNGDVVVGRARPAPSYCWGRAAVGSIASRSNGASAGSVVSARRQAVTMGLNPFANRWSSHSSRTSNVTCSRPGAVLTSLFPACELLFPVLHSSGAPVAAWISSIAAWPPRVLEYRVGPPTPPPSWPRRLVVSRAHRLGERVVQLGFHDAPLSCRRGEREEGLLAAGGLIDRRPAMKPVKALLLASGSHWPGGHLTAR